jgi:hypothetical protein
MVSLARAGIISDCMWPMHTFNAYSTGDQSLTLGYRLHRFRCKHLARHTTKSFPSVAENLVDEPV